MKQSVQGLANKALIENVLSMDTSSVGGSDAEVAVCLQTDVKGTSSDSASSKIVAIANTESLANENHGRKDEEFVTTDGVQNLAAGKKVDCKVQFKADVGQSKIHKRLFNQTKTTVTRKRASAYPKSADSDTFSIARKAKKSDKFKAQNLEEGSSKSCYPASIFCA